MNGKHGKRPSFQENKKPQKPRANNVDLKWIHKGIDQEAIEFCEKESDTLIEPGGNKGQGLTTSQIRNFYGEVMRIKAKGYNSEKEAILMLRPKLAYASARKGNWGSELLNEMLQPVLKEAAKSEEAFLNFCQFFEALLAFHKANGGKD